MSRLSLPLLHLLLLSGCFRDLDVTFDTDTDVSDTDVSDTDVSDTDVSDTDVSDTDVSDTDPGGFDLDGDGWEGSRGSGDDCDDDNATVYPGAYDRPDDGVDADCDGADRTFDGVVVDEGVGTDTSFAYMVSGPVGLDVALVFDISYAMDSWASLQVALIADATPSKGDARWSFSTYVDYAYGPLGAPTDHPFRVESQITDDILAVQSSSDKNFTFDGADSPESGMEALYQVLTGPGYDQDCDGTLDTPADVPPFIASKSDPFAGSVSGSYDASVSGTGDRGGVGFRDNAQPVVVLVTDNYMRDPDSAGKLYVATPGGCPIDAGAGVVVEAALAQHAWIVGIVLEDMEFAESQFIELADATGFYVDADGDGRTDDAPVYTATNITLNTTIAGALEDVAAATLGAYGHALLEIVVEDDPYGVVRSITPSSFSDVSSGESLPFGLELYGISTDAPIQTTIVLSVVGDGLIVDTIEVQVEIAPGHP